METKFDNKKENTIKLFIENIRGLYGAYGTFEKCIKFLFLKYMHNELQKGIESKLVRSMEDMQVIMKYQSFFMTGKYDKYTLYDAFKLFDDRYSLNGELMKNVESYELLFKDKKKTDFVLNMLHVNDFFYNEDEVDYVLATVYQYCIKENRSYQNNHSSYTLTQLSKRILNISERDIYMDPCCGYSSSLIELDFNKYIGIDSNSECTQISAMTSIMLGKNSFSIINEDYLKYKNEHKVDKVFAECPLGMNVSEDNFYYLQDIMPVPFVKEFELALIYKVLSELNDNGCAVVTVAPKVLFSVNNSYKTFREYLIKNHYLKSIIVTPSIWGASTAVDTVLLVLEKSENKFVKFIDYTKLNKKYNNVSIKLTNDNEIINGVLEAYFSDEVEGISKNVNYQEILHNELNLLPSSYIKINSKKEYRSLEKINEEIEDILNRIIKNIK